MFPLFKTRATKYGLHFKKNMGKKLDRGGKYSRKRAVKRMSIKGKSLSKSLVEGVGIENGSIDSVYVRKNDAVEPYVPISYWVVSIILRQANRFLDSCL